LDPLKVEHSQITEYLRSRRDIGLKTSTLYRELESIRAFHRYLFAEGLSSKDSAAKASSPKLIHALPQTLSVGQVERLLASIPDKKSNQVRFKAMLELLYATGMRVSELVNLEPHQLDLDSGFARVMGKGKKERIVPLGKSAKAAVRNYLALRSKKFKDRPHDARAIFLSNLGKRLGRGLFWRELKAFAKAAGILSNCPSGAEGGKLGWLGASDCAPEFAREIFGQTEVGVLARLVHSRFGLHVVEVLKREPGLVQPFEAVRGAVAMALQQTSFVTALRQYLALLAGSARVQGIEIEAAETAFL